MSNQRLNPLVWLSIALVVAIVLMVIFGVLSMSSPGGYYGMMGSGAWIWGVAMMAVPGIILILILVAALGGLGPGTGAPTYRGYGPVPMSASDLLNQRYARGEISREEYMRIRDDVSRDVPKR